MFMLSLGSLLYFGGPKYSNKHFWSILFDTIPLISISVIIFLISLIALISAYFIEYILGHQQCNLCLIDRVPYGLSIILISLIFILKKNENFFILLLILNFIFSFFISLYHFGIEQGIFQESTVCGVKNFSENISKEELLNKLSEKTISL